jgi:hypothetical protein
MKGSKLFPFLALSLCLYVLLMTACGSSHPPNGPGALNIANSTLPQGVVLSAYSVTLVPTGGVGPYTWTLNSGALPPGLTLSSGGVISGTPPITDLDPTGAAMTYNFVVKVTDSQTPTAAYQTKSFSIIINPLPLVTSTTLPNGIIGVPYTGGALTNSGGLAPFTWTTVPNPDPLPAGLSLSGSSIAGTPTGPAKTSNFTIQVTDADGNTASANVSITITGKLQGTFAFSFNGFNNGQPFYTVGSFVGDGAGNLSGVLDQNGVGAPPITKAPLTGTYSINSNGLGTMTLTFSGVTYNCDLGPSLKGDLKFILADPNSPQIYGSGVIKTQNISNLTGLTSIAGGWALGFFGVDNGGNRSAGAGSFKVATSGILTSGIADTNDNGTVNNGTGQSLNLTGSWALDAEFASTGRGTAALNVGGNPQDYAFYVVNPKSELIAVQTDPASSGLSLVSLLQPVLNVTGGGFSNGTLNASSVMELNGYTGGSSPLPDVQLGVSTFDGKGNITLFQTDENKGGTATQNVFTNTGTYNVDPTTGRTTVTGLGSGPQPVWYLVNANNGFVIGTDSSVTQGQFEPQSGAPFNLGAFLISYAGGTIQPVLASVTNEVDSTVIPAPGGTLVVTYDTSGSATGEPMMNLMLSSTYLLGDDPGKTGMNTTGKILLTAVGSAPTNSCMCTAIVYIITAPASGSTDRSLNKWASINIATPTASPAPDPNPRLTVVQSTSQ